MVKISAILFSIGGGGGCFLCNPYFWRTWINVLFIHNFGNGYDLDKFSWLNPTSGTNLKKCSLFIHIEYYWQ